MITPRPLHLAVAATLLAPACSEPLSPEREGARIDAATGVWAGSHVGAHTVDDVRVTVPFRGRFYTALAAPLAPDPSCDAHEFLNVQVGAGEATHLGRFTVTITFCIDARDLLDDGQLTDGESLPYDTGVGTLVAANGDELHIAISGAVLPSSNPDYDFEFRDPFTITGGTGRFAGASGAGMTNSLVDFASSRTTHVWQAMMELARGN